MSAPVALSNAELVGCIVRYGVPIAAGHKYAGRVFTRGEVKLPASGMVALNLNHDHGHPLGTVESLIEESSGVWGSLVLTPEGRAYYETGSVELSIEVDSATGELSAVALCELGRKSASVPGSQVTDQREPAELQSSWLQSLATQHARTIVVNGATVPEPSRPAVVDSSVSRERAALAELGFGVVRADVDHARAMFEARQRQIKEDRDWWTSEGRYIAAGVTSPRMQADLDRQRERHASELEALYREARERQEREERERAEAQARRDAQWTNRIKRRYRRLCLSLITALSR